MEIITCHYCGDEFSGYSSGDRFSNRRFCSKECWCAWASENHSGEGNPNWQGGLRMGNVYQLLRSLAPGPDWHSAREDAKKKAGHRCRVCDANTSVVDRLDVHHVIPISAGGSNTQENLMVCCPNCHAEAEAFLRDLIDYPLKKTLPADFSDWS